MADIYKSKFTGQEIDDILTNASNVTNIEANPSGEATEELTKITIGDTTYSIPEGTEGTVVEANPSGEATVELTKLKIGDTIYSISQGGGGGEFATFVIDYLGTSVYKTFVINPYNSTANRISYAVRELGLIVFGRYSTSNRVLWAVSLTSEPDGFKYYEYPSGLETAINRFTINGSTVTYDRNYVVKDKDVIYIELLEISNN